MRINVHTATLPYMTTPVSPKDTAVHPPQVSFPRPQGRELPARIHQQDHVMTGEAVALDIRPANPVQILIAGAIDLFVEACIAIATFLTLFRYGSLPYFEAESTYSIIGVVTGFIIVPSVVETLSGGRSLGKWILSVRIVRDDGGRIRFRHAFIRSLLSIFEI
ncbi:MAG TPA: RDD family protein, partial [Beutenbergiaceae bacterium]|nr:RDD family protein [Beutenbergiaceae bacterium]